MHSLHSCKSKCNVNGVVLQDHLQLCVSVAGLVSLIHDIHKVLGWYVCMVYIGIKHFYCPTKTDYLHFVK